MNLSPNEEYALQVTFSPTFPGDQTGLITLLSNDPTNPEVIVALLGEGLLPPDINVEPDVLTASLFTGDIDSSQVLTLSNSGFSVLDYSIEVNFIDNVVRSGYLGIEDYNEIYYNQNYINIENQSASGMGVYEFVGGSRIIESNRDNRDLPSVLIIHSYSNMDFNWPMGLHAEIVDLLLAKTSKKEKHTSLEMVVGGGDSGGGVFIDGYLVGIVCFIRSSDDTNSDYGDVNGFIDLRKYKGWINDILEE